MSAIRPLSKESADADPSGLGVTEQLTALGESLSAKLAEVEEGLSRTHPQGGDLAGRVAELRELLTRQSALQLALAERLESQVAGRTRELASLTNFLQTHAEREKAALARELHDSLGGILTPAKMDLAWLEARLGTDPEFTARMKRLGALIDQGIDLKRRIIETLRPSLLDHLGLASALQWYIDETCREAKIECRFEVSDRLERLSPDLEIALYRLAQEGLNNVIRHARATSVDFALERTGDGLRMTLADDGVGIADIEGAKLSSNGLAGMMHRVRSLEGRFDVKSAPGQGTRIEVFVPLKQR